MKWPVVTNMERIDSVLVVPLYYSADSVAQAHKCLKEPVEEWPQLRLPLRFLYIVYFCLLPILVVDFYKHCTNALTDTFLLYVFEAVPGFV
jgi:hypothetical protein